MKAAPCFIVQARFVCRQKQDDKPGIQRSVFPRLSCRMPDTMMPPRIR